MLRKQTSTMTRNLYFTGNLQYSYRFPPSQFFLVIVISFTFLILYIQSSLDKAPVLAVFPPCLVPCTWFLHHMAQNPNGSSEMWIPGMAKDSPALQHMLEVLDSLIFWNHCWAISILKWRIIYRNPLVSNGKFSCVLILINILTYVGFFSFSEEAVRYSVGIIKPDDVLEGCVEEIKQKVDKIWRFIHPI